MKCNPRATVVAAKQFYRQVMQVKEFTSCVYMTTRHAGFLALRNALRENLCTYVGNKSESRKPAPNAVFPLFFVASEFVK